MKKKFFVVDPMTAVVLIPASVNAPASQQKRWHTNTSADEVRVGFDVDGERSPQWPSRTRIVPGVWVAI
ncbi:MAG: hypothetical protein R3E58_15570 [Phycisphaerae bacterium]